MEIVETMERSEYDAIDAVNWSRLKLMRKSPLHFLHCGQPEDSDALKLGRAAHVALFEPHRFRTDFAIWKGKRRDGKEWEQFKALHPHETIIRAEERDRALGIAAAVRACPLVAPFLAVGEPEKVLVWKDRKTGLSMKARLDWLGENIVLDLKTARNAIDPRAFSLDAYKLGYFHQLEHYRRGVAATQGRGEGPPAVIVAVETEVPYDVAVYQLSEDALHFVGEELDELAATLVRCRAENKWPGKFDAVQELNMPRWAFPSVEDMTVPPEPDWLKGA